MEDADHPVNRVLALSQRRDRNGIKTTSRQVKRDPFHRSGLAFPDGIFEGPKDLRILEDLFQFFLGAESLSPKRSAKRLLKKRGAPSRSTARIPSEIALMSVACSSCSVVRFSRIRRTGRTSFRARRKEKKLTTAAIPQNKRRSETSRM